MQLCWPDNYTSSITLRVCSEGLPVFPAAMLCLMPHWNIWTRIIPALEGLIALRWRGPTWSTCCWGMTREQGALQPFHLTQGETCIYKEFYGTGMPQKNGMPKIIFSPPSFHLLPSQPIFTQGMEKHAKTVRKNICKTSGEQAAAYGLVEDFWRISSVIKSHPNVGFDSTVSPVENHSQPFYQL